MEPDIGGREKYLNIVFYVSLFVLLCFVLAGPGSRFGWWHFGFGFSILKFCFYGAIATLILWVVGIIRIRKAISRKRLIKAVSTLLIILILIMIPLNLIGRAKHFPRIHDITTDFEDPPLFRSILLLRKDSPNSAAYGGPEVSALQKKGYPDIKPLFLSIPPDQAFEKALEKANELKWEIVDANAAEKRIEATDTTFWFGFKDDIVIRITPSNGGSRIDLRSVSRVGLSDVGTNALRIRRYLDQFSENK
ncbi:MAG: DUF1499 domain-containing protein [Nitrospiria bacterium]